MNRKVGAPFALNDGKVHWNISKPTSLGGFIAWCSLIGIVLGVVTGVYAFYQSSRDTTKNVNRLEIEQAFLKAKVDSMESQIHTKLNTNRLILQQILKNTSTDRVEAEQQIKDWERTEKDSIAVAEKQRKEREDEILRRLNKKNQGDM